MILPEEWRSINDYDSHRPLLFESVIRTNGTIIELGCGDGSTPLLKGLCDYSGRKFVSLESNREWSKKYEGTYVVSDNYFEAKIFMPCAILFIDVFPGELRKDLIRDYAHQAQILVIHDSEIGAEYVYGMANVLNTFKFRLDYKPEGKPQTTAVSNSIDVSKWIIPQ